MNQSENINELVAALSKAQGEMEPAKFNKKGHKHQYADFTSVMHSCRGPLSANNLAIMQYVETLDKQPVLVTMLTHVSGQWIKSQLPLLMNEPTSQALGSAMTYMKRYGLSALLGIVSDADEGADDDGEASKGKNQIQEKPPIQEKSPNIERIDKSEVAAMQNLIQNLDGVSTKIFFDWIKKNYNASNLQDLPKSSFEKCMISLSSKIKYMNSKTREEQLIAVAE